MARQAQDAVKPMRLPDAMPGTPAAISLAQLKAARRQITFLDSQRHQYASLLSILEEVIKISEETPGEVTRIQKLLEPMASLGFRSAQQMVQEHGVIVHIGDGYHVNYTKQEAYELALRRHDGMGEAIEKLSRAVTAFEQKAKSDFGLPDDWQISEENELYNEEGLPFVEIHEDLDDIDKSKIEEIEEYPPKEPSSKETSSVSKKTSEFSKGFADAISREKHPNTTASKATAASASRESVSTSKESIEESIIPTQDSSETETSVLKKKTEPTVSTSTSKNSKGKEKSVMFDVPDDAPEATPSEPVSKPPTKNPVKDKVVERPIQPPVKSKIVERTTNYGTDKRNHERQSSKQSVRSRSELPEVKNEGKLSKEKPVKVNQVVDHREPKQNEYGYKVHSMEELLRRSRQAAGWNDKEEEEEQDVDVDVDDENEDEDEEEAEEAEDEEEDDDEDECEYRYSNIKNDFADVNDADDDGEFYSEDDEEDENDDDTGLDDMDEAFHQRSIALEYVRRRQEITSIPNHGPLSGPGFMEEAPDDQEQEFVPIDENHNSLPKPSHFRKNRFENARIIIPTLTDAPEGAQQGGGPLSSLSSGKNLDEIDDDDGFTPEERERVRSSLEAIAAGTHNLNIGNGTVSSSSQQESSSQAQTSTPRTAISGAVKENVMERDALSERSKEAATEPPKRISRFRAARSGQ